MSKNKRKVVVITGASAGVGRATAIAFAKKGYRVGLIARGENKLKSTQQQIERLGAKSFSVSADVSDFDSLKHAANKIENELGPIDVWVNNAMTSVFSMVKDMKAEEYKRVTDVVYHGSVNGTLVALELMSPRNKGHIVQVGSALAFRGIPLQSAYCGAKHAIRGFLDSVRVELIHDNLNIKVSEVQLPAVNTPQFEWVRNKLGEHPQPVPPIYQPEVCAKAIAYVAENPRRNFWLGYPTIQTILGNRVAPWLVDRVLARVGFSGQKAKNLPLTHNGDNVDHPIDIDYGARGSFSDKASGFSFQLWLNMNRGWLSAAAVSTIASYVFLKKRNEKASLLGRNHPMSLLKLY